MSDFQKGFDDGYASRDFEMLWDEVSFDYRSGWIAGQDEFSRSRRIHA